MWSYAMEDWSGVPDVKELFPVLNLNHPGLEQVRAAVEINRHGEALTELKAYYSRRQMPAGFPAPGDRAKISAFVHQYCEEELELVLRTADELLEQTFLFRFPWDMERTNIPVVFTGDIDWNHVPAGDPEWAYMLNRHRYWLALGQAYVLTGEGRYAECLCRQLEDWIGRNPLPADPAGSLNWRSIEAGLRGTNWTKAISYVLDSPYMTAELLGKLLMSLHTHAEYLARPFGGWKNISNWGVLESCGLLHIAGFLPEFGRAQEWARLALERMKTTASLQILPDGMHWEQSPTYHHEVLHCYLEMLHLSRCGGLAVDEAVQSVVHEMAGASLYSSRPDRRQPMTGDSDSTDISAMLAAAALLFDDPVLRYGGGEQPGYDNAWLFGTAGLMKYAAMSPELPARLSQAFPYSGNYVMRSGWDAQALYLLLRCAPLGGGHGHADTLHIDVYAHGKELLTDLGRYNYSNAEPLRAELKRPAAHNTTVVDNTDFTEIMDTWQFGHIASPGTVRWIPEQEYDYAEAGHDGYRRLADPVFPRRRILFIKPFGWLLVDSFDAAEEHQFRQYFHFAPGRVSYSPETGGCRTHYEDAANLCIVPAQKAGLNVMIEESMISYEYNLMEANSCAVYEMNGSGTVSIVQLLYPLPAGDSRLPVLERVPVFRYDGEQVDDAQAEAFRLILPEQPERIVLVSHRPPSQHADSYVVEGVQVFGEVVVIEPENREWNFKVIK